MNGNRSRIVLALAGLSVAIIGGLAAISCGGDDDAAESTSRPAAQATAQLTPEATATPIRPPAKPGEAQAGSITITGASVRETTNDVTAMYMTIKTAGTADRLISASTPISPMAQLHETVMVNGAMKMQEVAGGIPVPPAGEVVLKPGGLHIMIMNLTAPLKVDQTVTIELNFEKAGKVILTAPVKPIGEAPGMGSGSPAAAPTMAR